MTQGRPFCFVHSGDFHLAQPPYGLADEPEHLREEFLDAPLNAARKVFDAALAHKAAFVVLAGGVIDVAAIGPIGPVFLVEQFQRLNEQGVPVLWALSDSDHLWPAEIELPANVHRLRPGEANAVSQNGRDLARIVHVPVSKKGLPDGSLIAEAAGGASGDFVLAVAAAAVDEDLPAWRSTAANYWALGSQFDERTICAAPSFARYAGSPQGRCPDHVGPHGCTVVTVDDSRAIHARHVATDAVRFCDAVLDVGPTWDADELDLHLHERLVELRSSAPGLTVLVRWLLRGNGRPVSGTPLFQHRERLEKLLREESRKGQTAAWTVSIKAEVHDHVIAESARQDSFLGDLLRAAEHLEEHADEPLQFATMADGVDESVMKMLNQFDPETRRRILRDAARYGAELLMT